MRPFLTTLASLAIFSFCVTTWSQDIAADPFAPSPAGGVQADSANKGKGSDSIRQRKKAVSESGQNVQVASAKANGADKRIHAALNDETSMSFNDTPLEEAILTVSKMHDIPIVVDRRALEEIGLTPDVPVTLDLKQVTLRSFIRLMLRELDLTYMIKDEVMQITTVEAAEQNLVMEMYVLPDNLAAKSDKVITALQATVVPDTWSTLGGPSSALALDHVLVISSTSDVHDQVKEFLAKLYENYGK